MRDNIGGWRLAGFIQNSTYILEKLKCNRVLEICCRVDIGHRVAKQGREKRIDENRKANPNQKNSK